MEGIAGAGVAGAENREATVAGQEAVFGGVGRLVGEAVKLDGLAQAVEGDGVGELGERVVVANGAVAGEGFGVDLGQGDVVEGVGHGGGPAWGAGVLRDGAGALRGGGMRRAALWGVRFGRIEAAMTAFLDIDDRARLPWRFFGRGLRLRSGA